MHNKISLHTTSTIVFVKKCHVCGKIMESTKEIKNCTQCRKSFLPINYLWIDDTSINSREFNQLFRSSEQIDERDIVKGINVLW